MAILARSENIQRKEQVNAKTAKKDITATKSDSQTPKWIVTNAKRVISVILDQYQQHQKTPRENLFSVQSEIIVPKELTPSSLVQQELSVTQQVCAARASASLA